MKLEIFTPSFDSPLTDLIIELDHLRRKQLSGTTHPVIFSQLKHIFHLLESIGSARIEGNNTTVADFMETEIDNRPDAGENIQEIRNIEKAMLYIEEVIDERGITKSLIKELHSLVVSDLVREGDPTPGAFRTNSVKICGTAHVPPSTEHEVDSHMDELLSFINQENPARYDLLKVAVGHHRFMWIHPFANGNGRTGRLLTYAMLLKLGFIGTSRILNPTAVFCLNRSLYYDYLAKADSGTSEGMEEWCTYVLGGLKDEIEKIDNLCDYSFLTKNVLNPALNLLQKNGWLNEVEYKVLKCAVEYQVIQNSDIQRIFPKMKSQAISRIIRNLRAKSMLRADEDNSRRYHISFVKSGLIRGVIPQLEALSFIPEQN